MDLINSFHKLIKKQYREALPPIYAPFILLSGKVPLYSFIKYESKLANNSYNNLNVPHIVCQLYVFNTDHFVFYSVPEEGEVARIKSRNLSNKELLVEYIDHHCLVQMEAGPTQEDVEVVLSINKEYMSDILTNFPKALGIQL
jgi:hypothetical protein